MQPDPSVPLREKAPAGLLTWGTAVAGAASALCFWLWYARYLRIDFNELGRYYDPEEQVVYTDAAFVWGILALGLLLVAAVLMVIRHRRRA